MPTTNESEIKNDLPGYKFIYYSKNDGVLFVQFNDDEKFKAYSVKHRFYTPYQGKYGSMYTGMKDIYGNKVYTVFCDGRTERMAIEENQGAHNTLMESDIDVRIRWLCDHYLKADDVQYDMSKINICFFDIEVETQDRFPTAQKAAVPVNCVTVYMTETKKYTTFGLIKPLKEETIEKLRNSNCEYICCESEEVLLQSLFSFIGESNVDILTGWNCDGYDIPYLVNRSAKLGIDITTISRLPPKYKKAYLEEKKDGTLIISGTEVIDFLKLYKKYTPNERDDYKLDTIGRLEVGDQKAPLPDGYLSYKNYWDDYVWYNFKDVELMVKIEDKVRMFETMVVACTEARVPYSAIFMAKRIIDGFILDYLHKRNMVMPPLRSHPGDSFPGAIVYSIPNYYTDLMSYDYRSMYPSIMMSANISPETKVTFPMDYELTPEEKANLVESPWNANGKHRVFYRRDKEGIVPAVTKKLFDGRSELKLKMKAAKKVGDKLMANRYNMKQLAYKVMGNSLYGLLGLPSFQLYDIDNSASTTGFGRDLITYTIENFTNYIEGEFLHDERFFKAFGYYPELDKANLGTNINEDGDVQRNRVSHGDTDSFFMKFGDIYSKHKDLVGKSVAVYAFDGHKFLGKREFDIKDIDKAKESFYKACSHYTETWKDLPDEKKDFFYEDGMYVSGNFKIILDRRSLTDFARILDTLIVDEKLAEIMDKFAKKWNLYKNELFLKREKCVNKAIVAKKKKYICYVESNEDIKYKDEESKIAITGLELVRSDATPFTRKYLMKYVLDILASYDHKASKSMYTDIKKEFYETIEKGDYYQISIPSGVKHDVPDYMDEVMQDSELRKKVDWKLRSASVWNHLIVTDPVMSKERYEPIFDGSKVKFIKVAANKYKISAIAYTGSECPKRLFEIFTPDWGEQWEVSFMKKADHMGEAVGWSESMDSDTTDEMLEYF